MRLTFLDGLPTRRTCLLAMLGLAGSALPRSVQAAPMGRKLINVKDFGAVGDGVRDDGPALISAFKSATMHARSRIFFPPGDYRFASLFCEADDVEICGERATLLSVLPVNSPSPALHFTGSTIAVHDLKLDYAVPTNIMNRDHVSQRRPNAYGLRVGGRRGRHPLYAKSVRVERVSISNARGGGIQVSEASNVVVRDCVVRQVLGNGIGFDGCPASVLAEGNHVEFAGDDLLVIVTDSQIPDGTRGVTFRRNVLVKGFAKGIASSGVDGMLVEDNVVHCTYGAGIAIMQDAYYKLGPSRNVIVKRNIVRSAGRMFGPGLFRDKPSTVGNSIYVSDGTSSVRVEGNFLTGSVRDGIVVSRSSDVNVHNNIVNHHPGIGILVGDPVANGPARVLRISLEHNQITGVRDGIAVGSASDGRIKLNKVQLASRSDGFGLILGSLENVQVEDNEFVGSNFLSVRASDSTVSRGQIARNNRWRTM